MTVSKLDAVTAAAVDLARAAAEEAAEAAGDFGVGELLGVTAEGERLVTHAFACLHPAYMGWHWAVTLVRATRAKAPTVNEVVLLPSDAALMAPAWIPWAERIGPGDLAPGMLLPLGDNDPRTVPGYTGGTENDEDSIAIRAVVHELGLGRERLLSEIGRSLAAQRWSDGDRGPDAASSRLAPAPCGTCAFFVRLRGGTRRSVRRVRQREVPLGRLCRQHRARLRSSLRRRRRGCGPSARRALGHDQRRGLTVRLTAAATAVGVCGTGCTR